MPQRIDPDARRVDHAAGGHVDPLTGLAVFEGCPCHAAGVVHEGHDPAGVEDHRPLANGGTGEGDCEAGVVELAVPVADRACEARRLEAGRRLERRPPPEQAYPAEPLRTGERLVDRQADAVEGQAAEPARETVRRHDEGQRLGEMGSVVEKQPPFAERLADERDVALREVPHAAMHEFRGPTRRALGEVISLDEQRGKPADGGVHGHA